MSEDIRNPEDTDSYSYPIGKMDAVITLLAVLHVITGVLTIPIVYTIFSSGFSPAPLIVTFLIMVEGAVLALTIPVYVILGFAIWKLYSWAWKVSLIVNIVCLIFNIIGGVVLTALLNIVLLLFLNNSDVRLALAPLE